MEPPSDPMIQPPTPPHRDPNGKFRNPWAGATPPGLRDIIRWSWERRGRQAGPQAPSLPRATPAFATPHPAAGDLLITWIGHSSFLLQIGSANVLLDPIWSDRASPLSFAGPRRMADPGVDFGSLPPIDLVLVSHDHYDHLDRATVRMLAAQHPGATWVAPLEVGRWLRARGATVAAELDWWSSVHAHGLDITCTPAQHFSGRRPDNRDSSLWCGWVVRAGDRAVFFAGDTGRHPEFTAITQRLGPFDAALLPIGAYEPRWFMQPVHMAPEEAVSAYGDIAAANASRPVSFVAMHWGTFRLTDEPMNEPPALTRAAWSATSFDPALLRVPAHGETLKF